MPSKRIPFVGTTDRGNSSSNEIYQDCVFQRVPNEAEGSVKYYMQGRETIAAIADATVGATYASSITPWTGAGSSAFAVAIGDTNSVIYTTTDASTFSNRGTITGVAVHMSETAIGGIANVVAISNASGGRTWFYPSGGALTEITDVDFPPNQTPALTITGNAVHMNGRMRVMTTNGQIWESDINSLANWSAAAFISANQQPDSGVGLVRLGDYILGLGSTTIEPFADVGASAGSQLARVANATINIGITNQDGYIEIYDTVAFVGRTGTGEMGIYIMNGLKPKKISTPIIDEIIVNDFSGGAALRLMAFQSYGRQYLAFSGSSANCYVWHPDTPFWGQWSISGTPLKTAPVGIRNYIATTTGVHVNNVAQTAQCIAQLGKIDFGTAKMKFISRISLLTDSLISPSGSATLRTYWGSLSGTSVEKTLDLAQVRPQAFRWGSGRAANFYLIMPAGATEAVPRVQGIEVEYDVGTI